jgi:hypothetical protein
MRPHEGRGRIAQTPQAYLAFSVASTPQTDLDGSVHEIAIADVVQHIRKQRPLNCRRNVSNNDYQYLRAAATVAGRLEAVRIAPVAKKINKTAQIRRLPESRAARYAGLQP